MEYRTISFSEIRKEFNVSTTAITTYCISRKIKITKEEIGQKKIFANNVDYEDLKSHFCLNKICKECLNPFKAKIGSEKYCSKKCRIKYNRRNYDNKTTSSPTQSYNMKKTISDKKKMQECTVECLLEEFGDIE